MALSMISPHPIASISRTLFRRLSNYTTNTIALFSLSRSCVGPRKSAIGEPISISKMIFISATMAPRMYFFPFAKYNHNIICSPVWKVIFPVSLISSKPIGTSGRAMQCWALLFFCHLGLGTSTIPILSETCRRHSSAQRPRILKFVLGLSAQAR